MPGLSPAGGTAGASARLLVVCTNIREGGQLELLHLKAPRASRGVAGRWQRYVGGVWGDRGSPSTPQRIGRNDPLKICARWPLSQLRGVRWQTGQSEFWLTFPAADRGGGNTEVGEEVIGFAMVDSRGGGERFIRQLLDICPAPSSAPAPSRRGEPGRPEGCMGADRDAGQPHGPMPPASPAGGGAALMRVVADMEQVLRRMDAGGPPDEWSRLAEKCAVGKELLGSCLRREMLAGAGDLSAVELATVQTLHNRMVLVLSLAEEAGGPPLFVPGQPWAPWEESIPSAPPGPVEAAVASAPELDTGMMPFSGQVLEAGDGGATRSVAKSLEAEFCGIPEGTDAASTCEAQAQLASAESLDPVEGLDIELPTPICDGRSADDGDDDGFCVICFERRVDAVILECGHAAVCMTCAQSLRGECPVCRGTISRIVKLFYS